MGCFQSQGDAQQFQRQLQERFTQFNLEMAGEKTRMLLFGRFAAATRGKHGQRPETFEFLGFKHVCGVDRSGRFALIRIPASRVARSFLRAHVSGCLSIDIGKDANNSSILRRCCAASTNTSHCTTATGSCTGSAMKSSASGDKPCNAEGNAAGGAGTNWANAPGSSCRSLET